jgi:hypothetical protein
MPRADLDLPANGFALVIDGHVKTEFSTREGADAGARNLKQRFPDLRIGIYDAQTGSQEEV